jgi:hypothetical protein
MNDDNERDIKYCVMETRTGQQYGDFDTYDDAEEWGKRNLMYYHYVVQISYK